MLPGIYYYLLGQFDVVKCHSLLNVSSIVNEPYFVHQYISIMLSAFRWFLKAFIHPHSNDLIYFRLFICKFDASFQVKSF